MIYIKNKYLYFIGVLFLVITFITMIWPKDDQDTNINKLIATVINSETNKLTVQDPNNIIYTFNIDNGYKAGDEIIIEYTGLLDKNTEKQSNTLVKIKPVSQDEESSKEKKFDNMFSQFNLLATKKVNELTLEDKIGQMLLVRYPENNIEEAINSYKVGGFVFFEKDFKEKTTDQVKDMINKVQAISKIPLLTAVDEEGGDVVRISSNKNIIEEAFLSPRQLYLEGDFELIAEDTKRKSALLEELGLNINLAPVVDVSTNSSDYIYDRTIGEGPELTSQYAKTVIEANKGYNVSYVLKHFPGYGNNEDNHLGKVVDERSYSDIVKNDLPPFEAGIESGAEAILVSHNVVQSIDEYNPASLSASVHNLLRNDLNFTGIIITDDISMASVNDIENITVKALLAGNDIIITTDYKESFNQIKTAVENGTISESLLDNIVHRIISWKYYKGLMYEKQK